ncbi:hypothetical protein H1R20_g406, partial [Candolleomyces eurysporus]
MSPGSDTVNITKLYQLKKDGFNWAVYRDRTTDYLKSKGLRSHLNGHVRKPTEIVEHFNELTNVIQFFRPDNTAFATPLLAKDVAKFEDSTCDYNKNEGIGSDVLNNTLPTSIYCEIQTHQTLAKKWSALQAMFKHRGNIVQIDILTRLQSAHYTSGSMQAFLSQLTEWRNDLLNNDYTLSNSQFVTYITTSLLTTSDYRMFILAIEGAAEVAGTTLSLEVLKKRLIAEHKARNGINLNATTSRLSSATLTTSCSKDTKGGKKKKKAEYFCTICNINGHSKEHCYVEGGGKAHQAPEWYKKKQAECLAQEGKTSNTASTATTLKTANVLSTTYSCVTKGLSHSFSPVAMSVTTNEYQGIILDCGASDHFTPYHHLLTKYVEIQEHTRVANNRTIYIAEKGTMVVEILMGSGQPPTKLTLDNMYWVPSFVYTLILTTRMDLAGYTILQKGGLSTITAPDLKVIGCAPLVRGLYQVTDPLGGTNRSSPLHTNATTMFFMDFHIAMGHRSFGDVWKMIEAGIVNGEVIKYGETTNTPTNT